MKRFQNHWITVFIVLILLLLLPGIQGIASAQEAPSSSGGARASSGGNPEGQKKRIIILGTTIVGSVARPRVVYEVPWKDPASLNTKLDDPQRDFHKEIFFFLDKEQIETGGAQSTE